MWRSAITGLLLSLFAATALPDPANPEPATAPVQPEAAPAEPAAPPAVRPRPNPRMLDLDRKIIAGQATFAEVREALTNTDIAALTNTVHALYSMRWHRGVFKLLHDMWALRPANYPELQWGQFAKAPVRLALASTLLRIEPLQSAEYVAYLHEHAQDAHEFHRAQVLIGLAFKGDPGDVAYMVELASGNNPYLVQVAVTALGVINLPTAQQALEDLQEKFAGDPRATLIQEVARKAYGTASSADERLWKEMTHGDGHSQPAATPKD